MEKEMKKILEFLTKREEDSLKEYLKANYQEPQSWALAYLTQLCEGKPECDILPFNKVYKICCEVARGE